MMKVIDGIAIQLNSVNRPIAIPGELYTAIVPNGDARTHGLSLWTTEITEDLPSYDISDRMTSTYFRKALARYLEEQNVPCGNIDDLISQMRNGSIVSNKLPKLGRLYALGQITFAKMEINHMWSVDMWNHSEDNDHVSVPHGLWGKWKIADKIHGTFQITHKARTSGGTEHLPFEHCGLVASNGVEIMVEWLKFEFFARWGSLLGDNVTEGLDFKFDPSCVLEATPPAREVKSIDDIKPGETIWLEGLPHTVKLIEKRSKLIDDDVYYVEVISGCSDLTVIVTGTGDLSVVDSMNVFLFSEIFVAK